MSSSSHPPQIRFKNNVMSFSELISDLVTSAHVNHIPITTTSTMINIARVALQNIDADTTMTSFIEKSYPHWDAIKKKDVDFFLKSGMVIFNGLPEKNIEDFSFLFRCNVYIPEDANVKMSVDLYKAIEASGVRKGDIVTYSQSGKMLTFKVKPFIEEELMEQIWTFFHGSCKQSVSYTHFRRCPDPTTKKYTQKFISEISVKKACELWEIKEFF